MKFIIYIEQVRQSIYRANCPSLPGCSVLGSSVVEAQQKMSEAIVWYLAGRPHILQNNPVICFH